MLDLGILEKLKKMVDYEFFVCFLKDEVQPTHLHSFERAQELKMYMTPVASKKWAERSDNAVLGCQDRVGQHVVGNPW